MSPTHHHQQQRRNSVNANSDSSEDGPWQCSTPLVRILDPHYAPSRPPQRPIPIPQMQIPHLTQKDQQQIHNAH